MRYIVDMHILSSASCHLRDGCFTTTAHRYLAWAFVVIFLGVVAAATLQALTRWRASLLSCKMELKRNAQPGQDPDPRQSAESRQDPVPKQAPAYAHAQTTAENVKAVIQMSIGVITVSVVGWRFLYAPGSHPATLILEGTGVGLAAAAAFELAYTLFTPGPDEALDPLMLGLSATILLKLGALEGPISLANAGTFLILGTLLAVLFATRLLLAERTEGEVPNVWWIPRQRTRDTKDSKTKKID